MNFFEFSSACVLAISLSAAHATAQETVATTFSGDTHPDQFPLNELAVTALSGVLVTERETPGAGIKYLESTFGISAAGANNIIAVLASQAGMAPDHMKRVREYCAALSSVTSRADTLKVMNAFYDEDMAKERAKGDELLQSLDSIDREKLTKVLEVDFRPSTTKSELNFEAVLERTSPENYRKSVCDAAK